MRRLLDSMAMLDVEMSLLIVSAAAILAEFSTLLCSSGSGLLCISVCHSHFNATRKENKLIDTYVLSHKLLIEFWLELCVG